MFCVRRCRPSSWNAKGLNWQTPARMSARAGRWPTETNAALAVSIPASIRWSLPSSAHAGKAPSRPFSSPAVEVELEFPRFRGHLVSFSTRRCTRKWERPGPPYPEKFKEQIVELHRAGRSPKELAEELDPTGPTIRGPDKEGRRRRRAAQRHPPYGGPRGVKAAQT